LLNPSKRKKKSKTNFNASFSLAIF
jgi:hypothetical protein